MKISFPVLRIIHKVLLVVVSEVMEKQFFRMQTQTSRNMIQYPLIFLYLLCLIHFVCAYHIRYLLPLPFTYLLAQGQISITTTHLVIVFPDTILPPTQLPHLSLLLLSQCLQRSYFSLNPYIKMLQFFLIEKRSS